MGHDTLRRLGRVLTFAGALVAQAALGQWLETTVYLPDSLSGAVCPKTIACNDIRNRLYVGGGFDEYGGLRGGHDCWIVAIDGVTDERVARIGVPGEVSALSFCRGANKLYATTPTESCVTVIDAAADTVMGMIRVPQSPGVLCYNPTANKLYVAHAFDTAMIITVVDCSTDSVVATVHVAPVLRTSAMVCAPELNKVYCLTEMGREVAVIDCSADTVFAMLELRDSPRDVCYDTVGRRLFVVGGYYAMVVDAVADSVIDTVRVCSTPLMSVCFSQLHNRLYVAEEYGALFILDADSLRTITTLRASWNILKSVRYSVREDKVYVMDDAYEYIGEVHIVDCRTNGLLASVPVGVSPAVLVFNAPGDKVYCVNSGSEDVTAVSCAGDTVETVVAVGSRPEAFCYSSVRDKVYSLGQGNGLVSVLDGATNRLLANVRVGYRAWHMCYSSVSDKVYCPSWLDSRVYVIDCATDSVVARIAVDSHPSRICYSSRRNRMYVANGAGYEPGVVTVIDCATDTVVNRLEFAHGQNCIGYSPGTNKLYVSAFDSGAYGMKIFDCSADTLVARLPGRGANLIECETMSNRAYCVADSVLILDGVGDTLRASIPCRTEIGTLSVTFNERMDKAYVGLVAEVLIVAIKPDSLLGRLDVEPAHGICLNATQDKLYLASRRFGERLGRVNIVDCWTDQQIGSITVGMGPDPAFWVQRHNKAYVGNSRSGSVSIIRDSLVPGIAQHSPEGHGRMSDATVLRVNTPIAVNGSAELLDVTGRLVVRRESAGELRASKPGVYFLRQDLGRATRKLVLPR